MKRIINTINSYDIEQGYHLIKHIIDYVIERDNIAFISSEIAPNNFEGMKAYYNDFGQFLVYSGGDHGYLGQEYNIKFRALHDNMHLNHNLTFSFKDEKILSNITHDEFTSIAYNRFGATHWEVAIVGEIINAEIKGQIEYYELNKSYVEDQKQFINDYLEVS